MRHIVFSGQLGNGKDEVADITRDIVNAIPGKSWPAWDRDAFAGAVKDIYCHAFGVNREFIEQYKRSPLPPPGHIQTVRKALQFIGDGFRSIQPNVWINIALRDPVRHVIISDGRYVNEARAAHDQGGVNVVVWRPEFENDDINPSESEILKIVKWCIDTEQNGPISHRRVGRLEKPQGAEVYDFFFRNNVALPELKDKVLKTLIPYLVDRYEQRQTAA